jgi:hypothetical protein
MGLVVSNPESDESPRGKSPRQPRSPGRIQRSKSDAQLDQEFATTLSPHSRMSQSEGFLLMSSQSQETEESQITDMKRLRHRSLSKVKAPSNLPDFSKDGEKIPALVLESSALEKKLLLLGMSFVY